MRTGACPSSFSYPFSSVCDACRLFVARTSAHIACILAIDLQKKFLFCFQHFSRAPGKLLSRKYFAGASATGWRMLLGHSRVFHLCILAHTHTSKRTCKAPDTRKTRSVSYFVAAKEAALRWMNKFGPVGREVPIRSGSMALANTLGGRCGGQVMVCTRVASLHLALLPLLRRILVELHRLGRR